MTRYTDMATILGSYGLRVFEVEGWKGRGSEPFSPRGVVCFPEGVLILTGDGLRCVSEVTVGDEVWTHRGRWRRVVETGARQAETVVLRGQGHPGVRVTPEHPFWAVEPDKRPRPHPSRRRVLRPPQWVPASQMERKAWATPSDFGIAEVPVISCQGREKSIELSPELFWVTGRWLGDGCSSGDKRHAHSTIYCAPGQEADVAERVRTAGLACSIAAGGTATRVTFSSKPLARWLEEHFGRLAQGKRLPAWALGMPEKYRWALLEGYLGADGYHLRAPGRAERIEMLTVSKPLAIGLKLLTQSLGFTTCLYFQDRPATKVWPDSRVVRQRGTWLIRATAEFQKQQQCWRYGDWIFARVRELSEGTRETVYNLTVEEDESYLADGLVVHNCHHTVGPAKENLPSLQVLVNGRTGLPGPLCNVGLARDGTCYVIAAGRANHAGRGGWKGLSGNSSVFGIEAESVGDGKDWTDEQRRVYPVLARALVDLCGTSVDMICGHNEWAPGRKIDPAGIDMDELRHRAGIGPEEPEEEDELKLYYVVHGTPHHFVLVGDKPKHVPESELPNVEAVWGPPRPVPQSFHDWLSS